MNVDKRRWNSISVHLCLSAEYLRLKNSNPAASSRVRQQSGILCIVRSIAC
ncbi:hypothetical protein QT971_08295 [Microcoleus sp. herbarium19]